MGESLVTFKSPEHLNLEQIFNCGQAFRFMPEDGGYVGIYRGHRLHFSVKEDDLLVKGEPGFIAKWVPDFLDLDRSYGKIMADIAAAAPRFLPVMEKGSGIRILRQEPFEVLITFIISANNHIARIRSSVESLSHHYGQAAVGGGYAFASPEALAKAPVQELRDLGLGYRDRYVKEAAARVVAMGEDYDHLSTLETEDLLQELLAFPGVGPKVADCILLFAYGRSERFPVDTWIQRAIDTFFEGDRQRFEALGPLAGFLQQYLFYYMRETRGRK